MSNLRCCKIGNSTDAHCAENQFRRRSTSTRSHDDTTRRIATKYFCFSFALLRGARRARALRTRQPRQDSHDSNMRLRLMSAHGSPLSYRGYTMHADARCTFNHTIRIRTPASALLGHRRHTSHSSSILDPDSTPVTVTFLAAYPPPPTRVHHQ
jgi:hypothetical protein